MNAWPLDEGLIDYVAASYGAESEENPAYRANIVASPSVAFAGETIDARGHRQGPARSVARTRRRGGERHDRLSRRGVPPLGPGPERHRPRRRTAAGERLRPGQLLLGQLRPARGLSEGRHRPPSRRSGLDDRPVGARRRRPRRAARGGCGKGTRRHRDRHGQPLLRGARRGAHEARSPPARPGGGARLLQRQHPLLALLRRPRHPQRLSRRVPAYRRHGGEGAEPLGPRGGRSTGRRQRLARGSWTPRSRPWRRS